MKNEQEKFNRLKDAGYNLAMSLAAETEKKKKTEQEKREDKKAE